MKKRNSFSHIKMKLVLSLISLALLSGQACSEGINFDGTIPPEDQTPQQQQSDTTTTVAEPVVTDTPVSTTPPTTDIELPDLKAEFSPAYFKEPDPQVPSQDDSTLIIKTKSVNSVSYNCTSEGAKIAEGLITENLIGEKTIEIKFNDLKSDVKCDVIANTSWDKLSTLTAKATAKLDCDKKFKNENGRCEDFSCKGDVIPLTQNNFKDGVLEVPPRTIEGQCYSLKIIDQIVETDGNNSSTKTQDSEGHGIFDNEVFADNHDDLSYDSNLILYRDRLFYQNDRSSNNMNPYLLKKISLDFKITGFRDLLVSGSGTDDKAKVDIDNFILAGIYPTSLEFNTETDLKSYYRAYGTADSRIILNGNRQDHIVFKDNPIDLKYTFKGISYDGGTAHVDPVSIANEILNIDPVSVDKNLSETFHLDLRALDCGGSRVVSDTYLLFK